MSEKIRVLNQTLVDILGDQPHVGFSVFSRNGLVLVCNIAARQMYYGSESFDPIGRTVRDIEGPEFAAELNSVIEHVCSTKEPIAMDHLRFGRRLTSIGWPIRTVAEVPETQPDAVLAMSVLAGTSEADDWGVRIVESQIASWGALEKLTVRELEVLAAIGRGLSQKDIADELGITRKTVETHRARIGQKLNAKSSTELARVACESGFANRHVALKRQETRIWMEHAKSVLNDGDSESSTD